MFVSVCILAQHERYTEKDYIFFMGVTTTPGLRLLAATLTGNHVLQFSTGAGVTVAINV